MEIESLLEKLLDINDTLSQCAASTMAATSVTQKLARHRDILHEYTQEFRQTKGNINSMTEHAELLSSVRDNIEYKASGTMSPRMLLLRERASIHGSIAQLLTIISTIDDLNYPEKTDTYYIANAPYIFSACWKVINDEDLLTGEYAFEDVVLPLPGSRVLYPRNNVADVYHDLAKKDSISLMESVHSIKEFSITSLIGAYRRVFQRLINFEWELLSYNDANVPLVETDLDSISKSRPFNIIKDDNLTDKNNCMDVSENLKVNETNDCGVEHKRAEILPQADSIVDPDTRSPQTALKLGFTLPTSTYATMAIRELLKSSTSGRALS